MPIGATIIGGIATAGSTLIGANAANNAAQAQTNAANQAQQTQLQMFNQTRSDLQPYNTTGKGALTSLADLYGLPTAENPNGGQPMNQSSLDAFARSPDYQFALQQGVKAQDYSAASRGMLTSGAQQQELAKYASGLASQNFNSYAGRLQSLAGLGEHAASMTGSLSQQAANGVSQAQLDAGTSTAAGDIGVGTALKSGLTGLGNIGAGYAAQSAYATPLANQAYNPVGNPVTTSGTSF